MRQNFPRILEWISAGEEVAITRRRQAVARLVPWAKKPRAKRERLDVLGRLKKVFGEKVIPDETMRLILEQSRGAL